MNLVQKLGLVLADFPTSESYLVGVSGGRDSVFLLHALTQLGYKNLIACHLNHRLRGPESEADAEFVEQFTERLQVDVELASVDVAEVAQDQKISIEAAARACRHQFFQACAKDHHTTDVFLAHHADDQAETVLMNLLRGAGMAGAAGMTGCTTLGDPPLHYLRPMLHLRRFEITEYLEKHKLPWREDASNASADFTRNALRLEALPMLQRIMRRDVTASLCRFSRIAQQEDELLSELAEKELARAIVGTDDSFLLMESLTSLHPALLRRVIQSWLKRCQVPELGSEAIAEVTGLFSQKSPARVNLPGGLQVRRKAKILHLTRQDA